jgi:hypothetical protein
MRFRIRVAAPSLGAVTVPSLGTVTASSLGTVTASSLGTVTAPSLGWEVLITCSADPAWSVRRHIGKAKLGYPRPPAGEPDWWDEDAPKLYSEDEDTGLQQVHSRCIRGVPDWAKKKWHHLAGICLPCCSARTGKSCWTRRAEALWNSS